MHDIEKLESNKKIINEIIMDLKQVKVNSKVFNEFESIILKCNIAINELDNLIKKSNQDYNYTLLKVERNTLQKFGMTPKI